MEKRQGVGYYHGSSKLNPNFGGREKSIIKNIRPHTTMRIYKMQSLENPSKML
jgi:hypothetical protein